ncbi:dihydrolipoamide acetyltransferase family protein [Streptomyces sp. JH34]|uniref:dihydrolipoamide acetyltransferase family protein n=1 Tax=Streptomyces sp. JH34 TaxID=2793633 RepID=UPI0023F7FD2F|nr:dihydrolipoamide acetyltransferase family protein [Streptomyces sp. JH34]MDF6022928.1 2-oxo acid dehydrogenase subunit E2 [Streptomyces sp. JH34]
MPEFTMPSLGADMDEGMLSEWLVHPGDHVSRGDVVAVVETSKSAIEVECFHTGSIDSLLVPEGTTVAVGTPLALIGTGDQEKPAGERPGNEPPAPRGEQPSAARPESTAPGSGTVTPLIRRLAEEQRVDLTRLHGSGAGGRITRADITRTADTAVGPVPSDRRKKASPLARRLAAESGVDLAEVSGSGRNGTVRAEDVRRAARARGAPPARETSRPTAAQGPSSPSPSPVPKGADRAATARLMTRSKREIPHFYLSTTIDMGAALDWMRDRNAALPVSERLIPAALMLKAVARAAGEVPELNGHWVDDAFVPAGRVRLGVAVALRTGGLVAPALAAAEEQSLSDVMAALKDLVSRARKGRLRASETADPSITVTSLGDQGVERVFGVIYPPQVALVGLGRIVERPAAVNGLLGVRPTLAATLSLDHRAADGATGARFLNCLDRLLQRPEEL